MGGDPCRLRRIEFVGHASSSEEYHSGVCSVEPVAPPAGPRTCQSHPPADGAIAMAFPRLPLAFHGASTPTRTMRFPAFHGSSSSPLSQRLRRVAAGAPCSLASAICIWGFWEDKQRAKEMEGETLVMRQGLRGFDAATDYRLRPLGFFSSSCCTITCHILARHTEPGDTKTLGLVDALPPGPAKHQGGGGGNKETKGEQAVLLRRMCGCAADVRRYADSCWVRMLTLAWLSSFSGSSHHYRNVGVFSSLCHHLPLELFVVLYRHLQFAQIGLFCQLRPTF
jgi:hypothetical protein